MKPHKKQEPYRACNKLSCCKRENGTQSRETNFNMLNIFSWHVPVNQPVNKQNCLCQSFFFPVGKSATNEIINIKLGCLKSTATVYEKKEQQLI